MATILTILFLLFILVISYLLRKYYIKTDDLPNILLWAISIVITFAFLLFIISIIFFCNGLANKMIEHF